MEGRLLWKEEDVDPTITISTIPKKEESAAVSIPRSLPAPKRNKIRVAVSVDLDAVSGWLGTGTSSSFQSNKIPGIWLG